MSSNSTSTWWRLGVTVGVGVVCSLVAAAPRLTAWLRTVPRAGTGASRGHAGAGAGDAYASCVRASLRAEQTMRTGPPPPTDLCVLTDVQPGSLHALDCMLRDDSSGSAEGRDSGVDDNGDTLPLTQMACEHCFGKADGRACPQHVISVPSRDVGTVRKSAAGGTTTATTASETSIDGDGTAVLPDDLLSAIDAQLPDTWAWMALDDGDDEKSSHAHKCASQHGHAHRHAHAAPPTQPTVDWLHGLVAFCTATARVAHSLDPSPPRFAAADVIPCGRWEAWGTGPGLWLNQPVFRPLVSRSVTSVTEGKTTENHDLAPCRIYVGGDEVVFPAFYARYVIEWLALVDSANHGVHRTHTHGPSHIPTHHHRSGSTGKHPHPPTLPSSRFLRCVGAAYWLGASDCLHFLLAVWWLWCVSQSTREHHRTGWEAKTESPQSSAQQPSHSSQHVHDGGCCGLCHAPDDGSFAAFVGSLNVTRHYAYYFNNSREFRLFHVWSVVLLQQASRVFCQAHSLPASADTLRTASAALLSAVGLHSGDISLRHAWELGVRPGAADGVKSERAHASGSDGRLASLPSSVKPSGVSIISELRGSLSPLPTQLPLLDRLRGVFDRPEALSVAVQLCARVARGVEEGEGRAKDVLSSPLHGVSAPGAGSDSAHSEEDQSSDGDATPQSVLSEGHFGHSSRTHSSSPDSDEPPTRTDASLSPQRMADFVSDCVTVMRGASTLSAGRLARRLPMARGHWWAPPPPSASLFAPSPPPACSSVSSQRSSHEGKGHQGGLSSLCPLAKECPGFQPGLGCQVLSRLGWTAHMTRWAVGDPWAQAAPDLKHHMALCGMMRGQRDRTAVPGIHAPTPSKSTALPQSAVDRSYTPETMEYVPVVEGGAANPGYSQEESVDLFGRSVAAGSLLGDTGLVPALSQRPQSPQHDPLCLVLLGARHADQRTLLRYPERAHRLLTQSLAVLRQDDLALDRDRAGRAFYQDVLKSTRAPGPGLGGGSVVGQGSPHNSAVGVAGEWTRDTSSTQTVSGRRTLCLSVRVVRELYACWCEGRASSTQQASRGQGQDLDDRPPRCLSALDARRALVGIVRGVMVARGAGGTPGYDGALGVLALPSISVDPHLVVEMPVCGLDGMEGWDLYSEDDHGITSYGGGGGGVKGGSKQVEGGRATVENREWLSNRAPATNGRRYVSMFLGVSCERSCLSTRCGMTGAMSSFCRGPEDVVVATKQSCAGMVTAPDRTNALLSASCVRVLQLPWSDCVLYFDTTRLPACLFLQRPRLVASKLSPRLFRWLQQGAEAHDQAERTGPADVSTDSMLAVLGDQVRGRSADGGCVVGVAGHLYQRFLARANELVNAATDGTQQRQKRTPS